ncbi:CarD family transcriptional regulator [Centipeda periodontii DSM 2778]|uniref:CarD family transcriptional regulator n=1 Tax=Centipeda periodontii DSM 2778 TaxID=888060 RepID=F5RNL6_9FIRM|nr:hypothetical protein [Centipeda periodontii]EGK58627.1 CarD family transcriptional regulator [Centipeda periodontii DSM 2778]
MQFRSNAIHVDPADPRFIGGDIITQEEAMECGYDLEEEDLNMTDEERIEAFWKENEEYVIKNG